MLIILDWYYLIFSKLPIYDRVIVIPCVCKSWYKALTQQSLHWQETDLYPWTYHRLFWLLHSSIQHLRIHLEQCSTGLLFLVFNLIPSSLSLSKSTLFCLFLWFLYLTTYEPMLVFYGCLYCWILYVVSDILVYNGGKMIHLYDSHLFPLNEFSINDWSDLIFSYLYTQAHTIIL